jgi:hypothetical protein
MKWYWLIVLLVSIGVGPAIADDCPSLISAECGGSSAWFGLRWDGAIVSQGQTVLLPCNANLLGVEFKFVNDGQPGGSVPPMITGDPIFVTVLDLNMNEYVTAMAPMPFDVGNDWIMFEFDNLELEAGLYLFAAWTDVPRHCSVPFCPDQGPYPDGERYGSVDGLAGPWFPWYGSDDVPFRVYLDTGPVSTEAMTWAAVKSMYY